MPNKTQQPAPQQSRMPPKSGQSDVGRDTDNDGRVVQPGHVAGEVDGGQRKAYSGNQVGKDTDGDGRVVKPGRKPGEIDGDRQKQKH